MIKLEVANYCHDCPQFKPEVIERPAMIKYTTFYGDTLIACRDRARCEMMYKCISKAMEETNDKN